MTAPKPRGRPRLKAKDRRVTLAVRVERETRQRIEIAARGCGRSMGYVLDFLAQTHLCGYDT